MSNPADPAALTATRVTPAGADWLAGASCFPRSVHALWALRPDAPSVLPCGTAFDVVSAPPLGGRLLLERLWSSGPGSGPVAVHRGRMLLFAAPGTTGRLSALLGWEEWRAAPVLPLRSLLCHGGGDTVTVPAVLPGANPPPPGSRWLVAPDVRHPWLPGAETLLRACVRPQRPSRAGRGGNRPGISIFATPDRDAKVYDVSRRR